MSSAKKKNIRNGHRTHIKKLIGEYEGLITVPLVSLKLFNTLVRALLLYGSDFWGILKPPKNNPVENIHHMFCKHLLGLQKANYEYCSSTRTTSNTLKHKCKKMAIKNWERISLKKTLTN